MKTILGLFLLTSLMSSCAHKNKENTSTTVSFQEAGKEYEAQVHLPDDVSEKVPLVVVVHEWWGRTPYIMGRAKMLTDAGYAAMPIDLYGNNKTVETPSEAQNLATPFYKKPQLAVTRLKQYIEKAKQDPNIDPDKIYVIGFCFGGTQALNYARSGADIEGVVSFHGGLQSDMKPRNVKARVLVLNGAADPMVPAKDVKAFEQEMKKAGVNYKLINYPNSTHAFTNPNATEIGQKYNMPLAYNEEADKASWQEFMKFLEE